MTGTQSALHAEENLAVIKRESARGAAATFVAQGLKFLIAFGSQLVLARLIAPGEFGLLAMIAPVLGFAGIFINLGLQQATIQKQQITQAELSLSFWITTAISVFFALLLMLASPAVAWFYGEPRLVALMVVLALLLPLSGLGAQSYALMNRRMQFFQLARMDVLTTAVGALAGIAAAFLGAGYWSLVIVQASSSLMAFLIVWNASGWRPSRPGWDKGVLPMLKFGGHLTGFTLVSYVSSYIDNILIGYTRGPQALGLYDRAFKLVLQPLGQVMAPLSRVAVPMLSRLNGPEDELYRKAYMRMLQLLLVLTLPGLACACVMSDEVVLALLGPMWAGTAPILKWLSIAGMFAAYSSSTYWLFVSQGRTDEQMHCGLLSSVLIVVSFLIGLPWGPAGIAMSYAAFAPLIHGCFVWKVTRSGPVDGREVFRGTWPVVAAVLVSGIVLHILKVHLESGAFLNVLTGACVSYGFAVFTLACLPAGRTMLRNLWLLRRNLT